MTVEQDINKPVTIGYVEANFGLGVHTILLLVEAGQLAVNEEGLIVLDGESELLLRQCSCG